MCFAGCDIGSKCCTDRTAASASETKWSLACMARRVGCVNERKKCTACAARLTCIQKKKIILFLRKAFCSSQFSHKKKNTKIIFHVLAVAFRFRSGACALPVALSLLRLLDADDDADDDDYWMRTTKRPNKIRLPFDFRCRCHFRQTKRGKCHWPSFT